MPASQEMIARIEAHGHRLTEARRLVIDLLAMRRSPFTADELWREGRGLGLSTGRATIFRTLELLAGLGLLDRIHGEDGCHRYAVCGIGHHHHFVCSACGTVISLDGCGLGPQVQALARDLNLEIEGHHLEFFGRCDRCRQAIISTAEKPTGAGRPGD